MGSHFMDVMRRGIWASITGGWFYDLDLDILSNLIHLYFWMSLLVAPLLVYLLLPPAALSWGLYCVVLGFLFFIIKFGNHLMHHFFDTHESEAPRDIPEASGPQSTQGSLESLSENTGLTGVEQRRRSTFRPSTPLPEELELSLFASHPGQPADRSPTLLRPDETARARVTWNSSVERDNLVDESKAESNSNSVTHSDEPSETINCHVEIHTATAVVTEPEPSTSAIPLLVEEPSSTDDTSGVECNEGAQLDAADNHKTEGKKRNAIDRHLSDGQILDPDALAEGRPHRQRHVQRARKAAVAADSSVTSVLNQPTSSMETILSTFKPRSGIPEDHLVTSSEQSLHEDAATNSLRRTRSEFYSPYKVTNNRHGRHVHRFSTRDQEGSLPSTSSVVVQDDDVPNRSEEPADDGSTAVIDLTESAKTVEVAEQLPTETTSLLGVAVVDPPAVTSNAPVESEFKGRTSTAREAESFLSSEYTRSVLPSVPESRRSRPRRTPAMRSRDLQSLVSRIRDEAAEAEREPTRARARTPDYHGDHLRDAHPRHSHRRPGPRSRGLYQLPSDIRGEVAPRATGESLDAIARPLRASNLLRREREHRLMGRPDSPDPRSSVRFESITNTRGVIQAVASYLSGTRLQGEGSEVAGEMWYTPAYPTPGRSREGGNTEDDTHTNRYSPQASTGSDERRLHWESQLLPPGLSTLGSASPVSGRRVNFQMMRDPFWGVSDMTRTPRMPSLREDFRSSRDSWHLLDSAASARAERAALAAAGFGSSSFAPSGRSTAEGRASEPERFRIGPMTWRELLSGDDRFRRARIRKPLYKIPICPWFKEPRFLEIHLDRLSLMALMDRSRSVWDCVAAVMLAVAVGAAGGFLLTKDLFFDVWAFLLCFVMAGCQYSLLKSVQPDSVSPTHGFNRLAAYNRAIYFILLTALIGISDYLAKGLEGYPSIMIFGFGLSGSLICVMIRSVLTWILLLFPLVFAYGLLPQFTTFLMYFLEQVDIHVFGGSATSSLISAIFITVRNILMVLMLHGLCYAGFETWTSKGTSGPNLVMSCFAGLMVAFGYHMSRTASDPAAIWRVIRRMVRKGHCQAWTPPDDEDADPAEVRIDGVVYDRLRSDSIVCPLFLAVGFAIHGSAILSNDVARTVVVVVAVVVGFFMSYVAPRLRAQMPWMFFANPIVQSYRGTDRLREDVAPKLTYFEKFYLWLRIIERNVLYPLIFIGALSTDLAPVVAKFGSHVGAVIITVCGLKFIRLSFTDPSNQYLILLFSTIYFRFDAIWRSETLLVDYWLVSIMFYKLQEWLLKWKFVLTYVAPWQIAWGSAFHAFAQPFGIPHSGLLLLQSLFSTLLSSPLNPFLGSAVFLTAYPRPVKFWEKNYKTRRLDNSNTRLDTQLDGYSGNDDNNLNSIFYEHLTHSLQKSLCGDIMMGKWGNVASGDFFILASDNLNCLVHVIEVGNGLVSFQVRGLEFRGTYCQQREVEAITESVSENTGCFCCDAGHLPHMLSFNAAFSQRWLTWQVVTGRYILQGYSVSDNNAASMFGLYDLRKYLVTFYIKTVIYYLSIHPKLPSWLAMVEKELKTFNSPDYADLDTLFMPTIDVDYDVRHCGVSRSNFYRSMMTWMDHCLNNSEHNWDLDRSSASPFVTLAFAMSLCARRALGAAAQLSLHSVEWFLHGLHTLFKGDFRINCPRDEWVFADLDILNQVVAPALRMALKLHQDNFTAPDEYEHDETLYEAIVDHERNLVICHEGDPKWRRAVLANTPSLLALRHVVDDNRDEYKVIMLNVRNLDFRLIKANKECVRGFWAGQLQELIFFRNRNPERGSIQNAKQALRNMINSSCDQPIGYPIYVSPLTVSYAETHEILCKTVGGSLTWQNICTFLRESFNEIRDRCYASCSGSGGEPPTIRRRERTEPVVVVSYNPQSNSQVEFRSRPETSC